ncbi:sugar ABC transporter permease [Actinospica durhamensis]|uniref:Sugar ABC transporter permease n=1 Tax=Actinospica durhamensis TaxID=1508375 RepID=A0A941EW79_9ACTN|nr:sugar ABC transporter permease [Actinospica durhamensis]MBR7838960.1 sugar ABC transporter permease [Actinospica durhamensis]
MSQIVWKTSAPRTGQPVRGARGPEAAPGRNRRRLPRDWWYGYLFIAPFFVIFIAFSAYPMIYALELSFSDWHGGGQLNWVGFGNYTYLLKNPQFWSSLGNSGILWLLIVPAQTLLAVGAASLLTRSKMRFTKSLRTVVIVPYVTPLAAMAQAFILIFDKNYGVLNAILHFFHLPEVGWLTTTTWSKPSIAVFVLWKTSGFALIIMLAAVQSIPEHLYEAASLDGAGAVRTFFSITVPMVRRQIGFFLVISTLGISQMFLEPYVLTQGGPYNSSTTSGLYLYQHIEDSDLGTGAANSFLLVILVFLLSLIAVRVLRSKEDM